eukprot:s855_g37.t1
MFGEAQARPGRVSAVRTVPPSIPRPDYVEQEVELDRRTGLPRHPFMYCTEVKTPEQVAKMRKACALAREALERPTLACFRFNVEATGKVAEPATPVVAAPRMSQPLPKPENLIGAQIRVVTTFGEEIEGELFCVDIGGSNSVVLCQRLENGNVNYKWTKTNIIREVVATGGPPVGAIEEITGFFDLRGVKNPELNGASIELKELPGVDFSELEAKAKRLEEDAAQNAARYGVGVTEQAQDCYDALSKTMQAEWEGEDIKCMGCKISKPYDPMKSISGPDQKAVERVRKVLQAELGRTCFLAQRQLEFEMVGPIRVTGITAVRAQRGSPPADGCHWAPEWRRIRKSHGPCVGVCWRTKSEKLEVARDNIKATVTTDEVDAAVHDFVVSKNAYPSPLGYLGFKKSVSTSVNDVIAHGIPDDRPLVDGDILNVDVTVFVDGFHGDTSCMFTVGEVDEAGLRLCQAAQQATMAGIQVCGPGVDFRLVGERIEDVADQNGCNVSDLFLGHGIGSYFHGQPVSGRKLLGRWGSGLLSPCLSVASVLCSDLNARFGERLPPWRDLSMSAGPRGSSMAWAAA